jgi:hypothetical protein
MVAPEGAIPCVWRAAWSGIYRNNNALYIWLSLRIMQVAVVASPRPRNKHQTRLSILPRGIFHAPEQVLAHYSRLPWQGSISSPGKATLTRNVGLGRKRRATRIVQSQTHRLVSYLYAANGRFQQRDIPRRCNDAAASRHMRACRNASANDVL